MPIEFLCPQCNTVLETPDGSAGMQARCPTCEVLLLVPVSRTSGGEAALTPQDGTSRTTIAAPPPQPTPEGAGRPPAPPPAAAPRGPAPTPGEPPTSGSPDATPPPLQSSLAARSTFAAAADQDASRAPTGETAPAAATASPVNSPAEYALAPPPPSTLTPPAAPAPPAAPTPPPALAVAAPAAHRTPPPQSPAGAGPSSPASPEGTPVAGAAFALADPPVFSPLQLLRPTPPQFSVGWALAYGWHVLRTNFKAFFWGNALSLVIVVVAGFLFATQGVASPLGVGAVIILTPLAAIMASGWAALAIHGARGLRPTLMVGLLGFPHLLQVLSVMAQWSLVTLVWHLPFVVIWVALAWTGKPFWELVGGLIVLAGGILCGVRIGWVPFALWEYPEAGFVELAQYSLAISRGHTWSLIQVAILTYFAMAGTSLAAPFVALPLAMGIGGATYTLLARDYALDSHSAA